MATLIEQLHQWQQVHNRQTQSTTTPKLQKVKGHIGHARSLHKYCAVVTFPHSRGGGTLWYKSTAIVKQLEKQAGYKVTWL